MIIPQKGLNKIVGTLVCASCNKFSKLALRVPD